MLILGLNAANAESINAELVLGMVTVIGFTIGVTIGVSELVVVDLLQAIKIEKINSTLIAVNPSLELNIYTLISSLLNE